MQVMVNGQWKEVSEGICIAGLLAELGLEPRRVAVERNRQLVPRARHAETQLGDQDKLEIVTLVGGG